MTNDRLERLRALSGKKKEEPKPFKKEEPEVDDQVATGKLPVQVAPAPAHKVTPHPDLDTKTTVKVDLSAKAEESTRVPDESEPPPAPRAVVTPISRPKKGAIPSPDEPQAGEVDDAVAKAVLDKITPALKRMFDDFKTNLLSAVGEKVKGIVEPVEQKVDRLRTQLYGNDEEAALENFGGEPVVPQLMNEVVEFGDKVEALENGAKPAEVDVGAIKDAVKDELKGELAKLSASAKVDVEGIKAAVKADLKGELDKLSGEIKSAKSASDVAAIKEKLEKLHNALFGDNDEIISNFEGEPVVKKLLDEIIETGDSIEKTKEKLDYLFGTNHERLASFVDLHEMSTRRALIRFLRQDGYLNWVKKVAVDSGPETVKAILETFVEDERITRESLAQEQNSSIIKLDDPEMLKDPKVANLRKWVYENSPAIIDRAKECLESVPWEQCVAENKSSITGDD